MLKLDTAPCASRKVQKYIRPTWHCLLFLYSLLFSSFCTEAVEKKMEKKTGKRHHQLLKIGANIQQTHIQNTNQNQKVKSSCFSLPCDLLYESTTMQQSLKELTTALSLRKHNGFFPSPYNCYYLMVTQPFLWLMNLQSCSKVWKNS